MSPNAKLCIELVRKHEGGFSLDPHDPGNWTSGACGVGLLRGTKGGISAAAHPDLNIQALSDEDIDGILLTEYWPRLHGDELPLPLAMATLDAEVMSGMGNGRHHRAACWLQEAVGATPDGDMGPVTVAAAQACRDLVRTVKAVCRYRLLFLKALPTWPRYGDGWSDRVADTQAAALAACASPI